MNQIDIKRQEEKIQEDIMGNTLEDFFNRWAPEDPEKAHRFYAEFSILMRRMHMDLAQKYVDNTTAMIHEHNLYLRGRIAAGTG